MRHEKNTGWPLLSGSSSVDALALLRRFLAFSYFRIAAVRQSFVEAGIFDADASDGIESHDQISTFGTVAYPETVRFPKVEGTIRCGRP